MAAKPNIKGTTKTSFSFGKTGRDVIIFTGVGSPPTDNIGSVGDFYIQARDSNPNIWQKREEGWVRFARVDELGFYLNVGQTDDTPTFKDINTIKFNRDQFYVVQNSPNTDEVQVNLRQQGIDVFEINPIEDQFSEVTSLKFNKSDGFYLTRDNNDQPIVNINTIPEFSFHEVQSIITVPKYQQMAVFEVLEVVGTLVVEGQVILEI